MAMSEERFSEIMNDPKRKRFLVYCANNFEDQDILEACAAFAVGPTLQEEIVEAVHMIRGQNPPLLVKCHDSVRDALQLIGPMLNTVHPDPEYVNETCLAIRDVLTPVFEQLRKTSQVEKCRQSPAIDVPDPEPIFTVESLESSAVSE